MLAWDLADRLNAADTADTVWSDGLDVLHRLGVAKAIWMRLDRATPAVRSNCDPEWLASYGREVAERGDPFVTYCLPSVGPVRTGLGYRHRHGYMTADEKAFVAQACEETRTISGTSVTTARGVGGWNLMTELDAVNFDALFASHGADIALCAHLVDSALASRPTSPPERGLSPREGDCLTYIATGHRIAEIADRIGIAESTVEFHLRNARGKLGATTRDEAVARALIAGEISI